MEKIKKFLRKIIDCFKKFFCFIFRIKQVVDVVDEKLDEIETNTNKENKDDIHGSF